MKNELVRKEEEIEKVRLRLHQLVETKNGKFSDREVTMLSTFLDHLIVEYERMKAVYPKL